MLVRLGAVHAQYLFCERQEGLTFLSWSLGERCEKPLFLGEPAAPGPIPNPSHSSLYR